MKLKFNFIFDSAHVNNKTWIIKKEENQRVTGINKKTKKNDITCSSFELRKLLYEKKKDGILDIY